MTPSYSSGPAGHAGGRRAATFAGASVFLSRNLVAPEVFDAVHDALRLNGAEVLLCADPSRTGPLDFHVISSSSHERFADLRTKGCNLLGPQCILSCAKERRFLPKQSYTCCLAMDGVKILCSGFEKAEKAKIEELVTAMGGILESKSSMDVNFVIVKDVMAAKYKYAVNNLKPVVTMNWLEQCWIEHRVVPHEPYRILPFVGLNICVTKLNPVERKELEKTIVRNGGQFSGCLTRKCTHLVANEPGGDKYVVARRWGNIHIVNPRWVEQSVARRACLDENSYLVCQTWSASSGLKTSLKEQHNPEISSASASFQPVPATSIDDSVSTSQCVPASFGDSSKISNTDIVGAPGVQEANEMQVDSHVAEDTEAENDDLYLSNCRISLVGFEENELLRLLRMIRNGGGSRHILLNEKLTHIILGAPSEYEKKEVRRLAAWGVINVVKVTWLEDCNREKKEVKVSPTHVATELLLKEFSHVTMEKSSGTRETKVAKSSSGIFHVPTVNDSHGNQLEKDMSSERKPARGKHENSMNKTRSATRSANSSQQNAVVNISKHDPKSQGASTVNSGNSRSNVFKGITFGFSNSFSHDKRPEVIDWIREGGGIVVGDIQSKTVNYTIECHGRNSMPLRSCLEDTIVSFDHFQPKPLTSQDKEADLCTVSQYSTQASRFNCSELLSGYQVTTTNPTDNLAGDASANEEAIAPAVSKRRLLSVSGHANDTCGNIGRTEKHLETGSVPDVADAIEVLSSKIQDVQSPSSIFEPDNSAVVQDQKDTHSFGISRSWLNMQQKQENTPGTKVQSLSSSPAPSRAPTAYYPFSETQTESQIVGYEEDLTGRQKIIDRVRSQSINITPSNEIP
ncbi:DNA topoisomerase 2-binding protein 1-A-like isoform X7 [Panicum virgatum]|uniref:DNA topoisomerase 2-binding protein 1-A-like isoform X7 n=1 Tax=Panicum virgatum TaxID=38727 RepID=UPI0019D61FF3|nr:DNA topoisomerase 2-binding protein 1-A-like isoform X7 [Panicum virgatum]